MATAAQTIANLANAQKSTGPRTPEGKETASQNALKHGLFAREGVIRGEDEDEFEMHRERLLGQLNPVGPLEEILAGRIVDLSWRLQRAVQDQSEAFAALYERQTAEAEEPLDPAERAATLGRMVLEDFSQNAILERLLRYERRIESSLYRTLSQLRRVHDQLQKADLEDANTLERWREEDWNARKARAFASYPPPEVSEEVSSEKRSFKCEVSSVKSEEPAVSPGSVPTSNFTLQTSGGTPAAQGEIYKTNPNSREVSSEDRSFKCEVSSLKLEEPTASPESLPTSNFTLQTSGGTPTAQGQSRQTKPICAGANQGQVSY